MKKVLFLISCILYSSFSFAQFAEKIRSGRPGQSIGAYSTGKNVFQIQAGFTSNNYDSGDPIIEAEDEEWLQNTVIRYGITEKLEVSAVVGSQFGSGVVNGVNNTQIGFRYNLFGNEGARPAVALQARALLPLGTGKLEREEYGTKLVAATSNSITHNLGLITNIGFTFSDNTKAIKFYAINLSYIFFDRLSVFAEIFDNFKDFNKTDLDFDAGIGYFITNDFKVDVSTGLQDNLNTDYQIWFVDFGFSYRFHNRGKN